MKHATKRARVGDVTAHGLRHSYATLLLSAGFRLDFIKRKLRHGSEDITKTYVKWIHDDDLYVREPELSDGETPADWLISAQNDITFDIISA